ncbi:hypothetical protein KL910_000052 [Ogataea haglerorum]|nr:hypothetical protein KL945_005254 [Ogataea haglerorum]KAG7793357.1 hypothetical protein KL910_000052 [Ogataea haglerorum]
MNRDQHPNSFRVLGYVVDPTDVLLYFLAFIFPPVPVFLRKGFFSSELLIVVLLTILAHLPGLLYAVYIIYDTSLVTGSDQGVESRIRARANGNGDYQALNEDTEAQPQPQTLVSPTPQRPAAQFHYEDISPDTPHEEALPQSSSQPPSYSDAIKYSVSPPPVGDHKVQVD